MKALQHMDLAALIDSLSSLTDEYLKMQVIGNRSKDFYICKGKIERLQFEIEIRKSVERENLLFRTVIDRRGK